MCQVSSVFGKGYSDNSVIEEENEGGWMSKRLIVNLCVRSKGLGWTDI